MENIEKRAIISFLEIVELARLNDSDSVERFLLEEII